MQVGTYIDMLGISMYVLNTKNLQNSKFCVNLFKVT